MTDETKTKQKHHPKEKPLGKMTVIELREVAKTIEHSRAVAVHDLKKAELIALIKEVRGIKDEQPIKKEKKVHVKKPIRKQDIKQEIFQLKDEKQTAREKKDKKRVVALRRRINRLKKRMRRIVAVPVPA
jgi:hypothetical protein